MIRTYIFDFDGTLVDSMPTFVSSILDLLDCHSIAYGENIVNEITPLGADGTAQYLIDLGLDMTREETLDAIRERSVRAYCENVPAKPNARALLDKLKAEGARIYMLTANSHIQIEPCLARLGMLGYFTEIWSCDDLQLSKTDTRIYDTVAKLTHTHKDEILFLDDNIEALATARAAGLHTCGVYDDSSRDYTDRIRQTAERYVYDLGELI